MTFLELKSDIAWIKAQAQKLEAHMALSFESMPKPDAWGSHDPVGLKPKVQWLKPSWSLFGPKWMKAQIQWSTNEILWMMAQVWNSWSIELMSVQNWPMDLLHKKGQKPNLIAPRLTRIKFDCRMINSKKTQFVRH